MAVLFEVTDPRGYRVICTQETWDHHILAKHIYMIHREAEVQDTIRVAGLGIFTDAVRLDRQVYFRSELHKRSYLKVVVEFQGTKGTVVTAYATDRRKKGERRLWTK